MLEQRPAGDRRGGQAYRPLPVLPLLHDHLPVRRALHAPGRSRPRAYRGDLPAAAARPLAARAAGRACCPTGAVPRWRCVAALLAQAVRAGCSRALGLDAAGRHAAARARRGCRAAGRPRPAGASGAGRAARPRGAAGRLRQPVLAPSINEAAIRLLTRHGVEVVVAAGRGLLRRARPSHGPRARGARARRAPISTPGRARSTARGSTPSSSPPRAAAPRSRTTASCCATIRPMPDKAARVSALASDISEYLADARARAARATAAASSSPIIRPARCSTARRSRASRRIALQGRASWSRMCRKGISAAARPAPTTCCSRTSPRRLRDRKVGNIETARRPT